MQPSVGLLWLGALLVLGGVLLTVAKALSRGRLSELRRRSQTPAGRTLEPSNPAGGLSLKANWIGLSMIALGFLLLLSGAVV